MLTIRQSQIHTLGEARRKEFALRLLHMFEADYPVEFENMGRVKAEAFVARTSADAEKYGLRTEGAVITFLGLRVEFGEEFKLSPDREWAIGLLSHPTLPDVLKISMIRDRMRERTQGRRIETIRVSGGAAAND